MQTKNRAIILKIVKLTSILIVGAIVLGFLGKLFWLFEILSHFYHIYFFVSLITVFIFWWQKDSKFLLLNFILLIISGWLIFQPYLPTTSNQIDSNNKSFRIMSYNTNFFFGSSDKIITDIENSQPDIVVLIEPNQETFAGLKEKLGDKYPFTYFLDNQQPSNMAFLSKTNFSEPQILTPSDSPANLMRAEFKLDNRAIALYAIHPYPPYNPSLAKNRREYYKLMIQKAQTERLPVLFIGDFNTTPWSPLFRDIVRQSGLRDSRQSFGYHGTWPSFLPSWLKLPIDLALVSQEILIKDRFIDQSFASDHLPQILDIAVK